MKQIKTINRGALTVLPKKLYYDWGNAVLTGDLPMNMESDREATTYLVDEELEFADKALDAHWEAIFEQELFSMSTDESTWPQDRSLEMFKEWFSFSFASMIIDLGEE